MDNIFLPCEFASEGWSMIFDTFGLVGCLPKMIYDWRMYGLNGGNFCGKGKILWRCSTLALLLHLWNERNNRMFEDKFIFFSSFLGSCSTYSLLMVYELHKFLEGSSYLIILFGGYQPLALRLFSCAFLIQVSVSYKKRGKKNATEKVLIHML